MEAEKKLVLVENLYATFMALSVILALRAKGENVYDHDLALACHQAERFVVSWQDAHQDPLYVKPPPLVGFDLRTDECIASAVKEMLRDAVSILTDMADKDFVPEVDERRFRRFNLNVVDLRETFRHRTENAKVVQPS